GSGGGGGGGGGGAGGGVQQLGDAAAMLGREIEDGGKAQPIEVRALRLLSRAVDLVHGHEHGALAAAQDTGDLLVEGGQARASVDHEHHEVGLVDGGHHLVAHGGNQVRRRPGIEAASAHHGRLPALEGGGAVQAIARHSRHVVDDGAAPTHQAVEESGLADVGPAHKYDDGANHGQPGPLSGRGGR